MRSAVILAAAVTLAAAPANVKPQPRVRVAAWADAAPAVFTATADGEKARVTSVRGPSDDLMLLTVIDLTADLALAEPAKAALKTGIAGLPAKSWAGVLRAQDGLRVLSDPSSDRDAAAKAIDEVPVSGRAGLLETIEPVADLADSLLARSPVRVAVLYVTDSDIYNYREDYTNPVINSSDSHDLSRRFPEALIQDKTGKLAAKLASRQAPVFIVHIAYRSGALNEAYQRGLDQLARATGGTAWFCRSMAEIPDNIQAAMAMIQSHYRVDVELPGAPRREFQIHLSAGDTAITHRARFTAKKD